MPSHCHKRSVALALLVAALSLPQFAFGIGLTWVGGNGDWEDGANWSGGLEPIVVDDVTISGMVEVTSSDALNEALSLIANSTLFVTAGVLDILGLATNTGNVTIDGGTFESNTLSNEATGSILIQSVGSELSVILDLDNAGSVTVKQDGALTAADISNTGIFKIQTSATASAETMVNDVGAATTIENLGSELNVDDNVTNAGLFSILDHGSFSASSYVNFDRLDVDKSTFASDSLFNAALGQIQLTGMDTLFTVNGNITNQGVFKTESDARADIVSIGNELLLEVSTGGLLEVVSILNSADGDINVKNADSRLALSDNLQTAGGVDVSDSASLGALSIGNSGALVIRTGGTIDTESIANSVGGTIDVAGSGSEVVLTNNFENEGGVDASSGAVIEAGSYVNRNETELVTGARLTTTTLMNTAPATMSVSGIGTELGVSGVLENSGALKISNSAMVSAGTFEQNGGATILDLATLTSTGTGIGIAGGTLEGVGDLVGDLIVGPGGQVLPGSSTDPTATLDVDGTVALSGSLFIDIANTPINDFDRVVATGLVTVGGTLDVRLLDGFEPVVGDVFDILLGSALMGSFGSTVLPVFDGRTFEIIGGPDFLRLAVTNVPVPGAIYLFLPALLVFLRTRSTPA